MLEIIPDQIDAKRISEEAIAGCLSGLRSIWDARGSARGGKGAARPRRGPEPDQRLPSMRSWELSLESALREDDAGASGPFAGIPEWRSIAT